ncbi:MAG: hypothetical protein ACUVUU_01880 [bacterium]
MKKILWILLGVFSAVLIAGCYTVIVHPRVEDTDGSSYRTRYCSDCHASADFYYWHWPYYDRWYWSYPHWRSYYCYPWWWNDYWYWKGDTSGPTWQEPRYFEERMRPATPVLPGGSRDVGEEKKTQKTSPPGQSGADEKQKSQRPRYFDERKRPLSPNKPDTEKKQSGKEKGSEKQEKNTEEEKK